MEGVDDKRDSIARFSDHLEHLRRVHFGVVLVTTGVLIVSAVDPTSSLESANSDLVAIDQTIKELNERPDWLSSYVRARISSSSSLSRSRLKEDPVACRVLRGPSNFLDFGALSHACSGGRYFYADADGIRDRTRSGISPQDRGASAHVESSGQWQRTEVVARSTAFGNFNRLSEFKTAWDQLADGTSIHVVLEIAPRVLVFDAPDESFLPYASEANMRKRLWLDANDYDGPSGRWTNLDGSSARFRNLPSAQSISSLWHGIRDWNSLSTGGSVPGYDLGNFTFAEVLEKICQRRTGGGVCRTFRLPLRVQQFSIDDQEHLIQIAQQTNPMMAVRTGTFAVSFPELNAVTENVDGLPIERLLDHLDSMSQMSGLNFSAFGITIPGGAVASFGPIFVLIICLYFFLHVRQFNRISSRESDTHEYPWIGLYGGLIARLATFGSIALYPILTCIFLVVRYEAVSGRPSLMALWPGLVVLAVATLSIGNGRELARLRSRGRAE